MSTHEASPEYWRTFARFVAVSRAGTGAAAAAAVGALGERYFLATAGRAKRSTKNVQPSSEGFKATGTASASGKQPSRNHASASRAARPYLRKGLPKRRPAPIRGEMPSREPPQ